MYAKLSERAEKGEKSANELYEKIHNLSHQVSSISSQNSSRNLSQNDSFRIFGKPPRESQIRNELYNGEDSCDSDQETPGNNQSANFGLKNANDHININLNVNQKENVLKLDKEKDFEEDKKEDEKK